RARAVLVEANQLEPAPEAAEREPRSAVLVEGDVGVDRVPVVWTRFVRADDGAMIVPLALVERGARGVTDARVIAAERRGRVVKVVLAVEIRDVGRPEVHDVLNVLADPRRVGRENGRAVLPG